MFSGFWGSLLQKKGRNFTRGCSTCRVGSHHLARLAFDMPFSGWILSTYNTTDVGICCRNSGGGACQVLAAGPLRMRQVPGEAAVSAKDQGADGTRCFCGEVALAVRCAA